MRRKLMITLLTMTMTATLFVGCGTSETVETPVVEETVEEPEVVEQVEENATIETEENTTVETEETTESETVAKPKASTHYKEWKEKQEEVVEEPEVAENKEETTKKETEKKDTTTTASTSTTNTNNNTTTSTPTPEPTPSNDNTPSPPVAETPAAPAAPSNNGEHVHNWVRTVVNQVTYTKSVGTGQYEQVVVGYTGGEPIWGEYGDLIGATPQEPIYETREIMTTQVVTEDVYANVCSTCGAVQ